VEDALIIGRFVAKALVLGVLANEEHGFDIDTQVRFEKLKEVIDPLFRSAVDRIQDSRRRWFATVALAYAIEKLSKEEQLRLAKAATRFLTELREQHWSNAIDGRPPSEHLVSEFHEVATLRRELVRRGVPLMDETIRRRVSDHLSERQRQDSSAIGEGLSYEPPRPKKPKRPFRKGRILFNPPKTMWVGISETIELRLSAKDVLTLAERSVIEKTMVGRGEQIEELISRVGARMKAVLYCDEDFFAIKELSSPEQDLDLSSITLWDWSVKPLKSGETILALRLTVKKDLDHGEFENDLEALRSTVTIRIRSIWTWPVRFWRDHWKWLITTVLAIGGLVVAIMRLG